MTRYVFYMTNVNKNMETLITPCDVRKGILPKFMSTLCGKACLSQLSIFSTCSSQCSSFHQSKYILYFPFLLKACKSCPL